MSYKTIITTLLFLSFFGFQLSATGPSHMQSTMKPIATNKKGDILCRTRFYQNPSGGYYELDIQYGLCIITKDTLLHTQSYMLKGHSFRDWEEYHAHSLHWDSIYESKFDPKLLSKEEYQFIDKYKFKRTDIEQYEVNDTLSLADFKIKTNIDLTQTAQIDLHETKGFFSPDCQLVDVRYNFGNVIFIHNEISSEDENEDYQCISASFNYPNLWNGYDIGYDYPKITGVVFVKPENNYILPNISRKKK